MMLNQGMTNLLKQQHQGKQRDSDDITNNDETTEKLPSSETVDTNESEEVENNESELAQTFVKNKRIS
ncbi:hypothetical protein QLX08_001283 [Tetragonisca angustula]|uniref:Uncharacterized protein n=1 Tax=Tetragonisca angustula TaxID=166442 RepID=A0AAW1AG84_9HYME